MFSAIALELLKGSFGLAGHIQSQI